MRSAFGLAARFHRAAPLKFFLLSVLVAVGMTVLLIVTELSRISTSGLDDAVEKDIGVTGSYTVDIDDDLGLSSAALTSRVEAALAPFVDRHVVSITVLPAQTSDCPPLESLGALPFLVLQGGDVHPPYGAGLPDGTRLCLGGLQVPLTAVYLPTRTEQQAWGSGLVLDPEYTQAVASSTAEPIVHHYWAVTGSTVDVRDEMQASVLDALDEAAQRFGLPSAASVVSVVHNEQGDSIRSASDGIRIVYGVIGWGVLVLGALGLLVAELVVIRGRTWFFGLARAVGARRLHILALITADVLFVLLAGTLLAVATAALVQPAADDLAWKSFQLHVHLLGARAFGALIGGAVLVLGIAVSYPAVYAMRADPVRVLEPPS
ncbi:FtsX-like permease family protein [Cellulomonas sp. PhB150]|uniref:FtsX-like permease family protein n=1 Tax=Cellulomonas sp. PhB150 TaxID=2485188 RepID=UPI000F46EE79|nr:FtsX-like permease family protein [Cellulomonas sp. PhB150]ROS22962.1 FtsX-like permease family protein [Cellulomonas sp. PhB150]